MANSEEAIFSAHTVRSRIKTDPSSRVNQVATRLRDRSEECFRDLGRHVDRIEAGIKRALTPITAIRSSLLTYSAEVSTTVFPTRTRSTGIPHDPATVVLVFNQLLSIADPNVNVAAMLADVTHKSPAYAPVGAPPQCIVPAWLPAIFE